MATKHQINATLLTSKCCTAKLSLDIVMLCPGTATRLPSSYSQSDGMFVSARYYQWSTDLGEIGVFYRWNRASDKVNIAGSTFARKAGNAFVARRAPDGRWLVQQLSSISPSATASDALRQIQQQLPEDEFVASLSILYDVEAITEGQPGSLELPRK
jgi:hypothetical protein